MRFVRRRPLFKRGGWRAGSEASADEAHPVSDLHITSLAESRMHATANGRSQEGDRMGNSVVNDARSQKDHRSERAPRRCELSRSDATTVSTASTSTASTNTLSLGFRRSDSPDADADAPRRAKDDITDPLDAGTHTQTIYSAQSSGEYNLPAIYYSIDFEGWLNGRLHQMFQVRRTPCQLCSTAVW